MEWGILIIPQLRLAESWTLFNEYDTNPKVKFHFTFCGEECTAVITFKNYQDNWNCLTAAEAPEWLFIEFVKLLEDVHWDKMMEFFRIHIENEN